MVLIQISLYVVFPPKLRVENLKRFKSDDGDCPSLVCTDLAARGLDLDVDHVIMFDFPSNSVRIISMASFRCSSLLIVAFQSCIWCFNPTFIVF